MGEISKEQILAVLNRLNPDAKSSDIVIYTDAFLEYRAAQSNISEHGSVVFHPRTGSPIDNPYVKVRDRASELLRKMRRIECDELWK